VATLAERILEAIRYAPLDDDVLARRLGVSQRQSVNQAARRLEAQGKLRRLMGPDGKIVNALTGGEARPGPAVTEVRAARTAMRDRITEDDVKTAVSDYFAARGYDVKVAWDRTRGIDVDARHPNGIRYVIEAKAETGTSGAQQVNYFIGMLGRASATDGRRKRLVRDRLAFESPVQGLGRQTPSTGSRPARTERLLG
jgi:hypothetical protein